MNDFTHDEWKEIERCLSYMIHAGYTPYSNLTISLSKKIKSNIKKGNCMLILNEEQSKKILSYLKEKWGGTLCPMCQIGSWVVDDKWLTLENPEYYIPAIPVYCNNCSNIILINGIMAGIFPPQTTKSEIK